MLVLEVGRTYFHLTFADPDLTMPGVEPLVYLGDAEPENGEAAHIFQDTVSYSRFGSRLDMAEDHDEVTIYFIPRRDIGSAIVDVEHVAREVEAAASRAKALKNPRLRVLRDGWRQSS